MNGVYIHIPFCKSKCPYCDFYSYRCTDEARKEYVDAIIDEINTLRRASPYLDGDTFCADTLYIGGGTPSVLCGEDIERIVSAARKRFNMPESSEITIECNPASDIEALIPHFLRCGINRVSLGMQSAIDEERKILGRSADRSRISEVIALLKKNGITNISLDIMLGIPNQTPESLTETLRFAIACDITHISAYILKIEEGTFFDTHSDRYTFPDEDEVCSLYELCSDFLEKAGFEQYEISNFSKPSFHSRHNTKYWILDDYLGIGAAAHSLVNGQRFYYPADSEAFINGATPIYDGEGNTADEYIMLRLRLRDGIRLNDLASLYGEEYLKLIKEKAPLLAKQGLVIYDGKKLSLTKKGFLLSNSVIAEFLSE